MSQAFSGAVNPQAGLINQARVTDYLDLLKPKVMTLVVFSGFAGMYMAPGFDQMHPVILMAVILSLAIGAGAAGAINMWYDRDIDQVMTRTRNRPIPLGRVPAHEALSFGIILSVFAVMTMMMAAGLMPAGLLAGSILFYAVIYTMILKRRTPQNIVIGGAAGAFPPMIGYAAVTGDVSVLALALFALIFFWTPPHFWALSLFIKEEYARAGIPMMPVVKGVAHTKLQILAYSFVLLPISILPTVLGAAGVVYGAAALILSLLFICSAWRVWVSDDLKPARAMFGFSIVYLFALFALMMVDKI